MLIFFPPFLTCVSFNIQRLLIFFSYFSHDKDNRNKKPRKKISIKLNSIKKNEIFPLKVDFNFIQFGNPYSLNYVIFLFY